MRVNWKAGSTAALATVFVCQILLTLALTGCGREQPEPEDVMKIKWDEVVTVSKEFIESKFGISQCKEVSRKYRIGRMVPLADYGGDDYFIETDLYKAMPPQLRAGKWQEVRMIVFVHCSESRTANYTDGFGGYRRTLALKVVVPDRKEFFNLGDFTGPPPPDRKEFGSTVYGPQPRREAADALLALDEENR